MEKTLSTKRKVILKDMSCDDMAIAQDICRLKQEEDGFNSLINIHQSNRAWLRGGGPGGDFKVKINGSVPDEAIKELSETEKVEIVELIRKHNYLGK